ncbi:MAG: hypothetical protein M9938_02455 [Solirubrobacterales bacterium]|nr:hypothetical protein [Solirubrobacterales bacterium]
MEDAASDQPAVDPAGVEELRRAVSVLARDVETLTDRVSRLGLAVEALGPAGPAASAVTTADPARRPVTAGPGGETKPFRVVVSPVAELAMAAVAETSLRGLPPVRRMVEVTRADDEVRFELELESGNDLVEPLRSSLPVNFDVTSSSERELVISLRPAWRPPARA